jgi:hypothetical protein
LSKRARVCLTVHEANQIISAAITTAARPFTARFS